MARVKMTPKLNSKYDHEKDPGIKCDPESNVEQTYVPTRVRVERLIAAGERYNEWKKEQFDIWMEEDRQKNG
jgi:hypothetical protein